MITKNPAWPDKIPTDPLAGAPGYKSQSSLTGLTDEQLAKWITQQPSTWTSSGSVPNQTRAKTLGDFSETEMIMELIGRGFAVSKLPVDEHVGATNA